jgi:carbon-monoxide dehydrogenase small subunit
MLAVGVLEREPDLPPERLREVLASNLCRCTGYQQLVAAVEQYAADRRWSSER